ncbi:MAG: hypothetical protein OEW87_15615 [Flavobacteriaceae bacterium]|nr:hypothetical protein [Flavobacteriaceae bacterium]
MYITLYESTWYDLEFKFIIPFLQLMALSLFSFIYSFYKPRIKVIMLIVSGGFLCGAIFVVASEFYHVFSSINRLENGDYKTFSGRIEVNEPYNGNNSYIIIAGNELVVDNMKDFCYRVPFIKGLGPKTLKFTKFYPVVEVGDYVKIKYYEYEGNWSSRYPVKHCILKIEKIVEPTEAREPTTMS